MEEKRSQRLGWGFLIGMTFILLSANVVFAQGEDPTPPDTPVKLVFIHHSTGENWLADEWGGLGQALMQNNYFVSDTNYGWGPDGIGDRTDIVDWQDWFRGPESQRYMAAVYSESEQHASYSRLGSDPGGENSIVMFKSCFPNSDLSGSPDDPPTPGRDYTVANAKYIYNDLLAYFRTRPDKLFVVVTAPPLSDSTHAANARAFNTWLMQDWLTENDYTGNNVVVFDFYNILTDPDNHHRYHNGGIEYINDQGSNTLYYPSSPGDDHPNPKGSRKATDEFVVLLNVYYNRWRQDAPESPIQPAPAEQPEQPAGEVPEAMTVSGLIDGFEQALTNSSEGWQGYWDETMATSMNCALTDEDALSGSNSLKIDFNVLPESWATCVAIYDQPQDWSAGQGVSFYYRASQAPRVFEFIVYAAPVQENESYEFSVETVPESTQDWVRMDIPWENLLRASWEENAGTPLTSPNQVSGFGFGFTTYEDTPNAAVIWVDDISLISEQTQAPPAQQSDEEAPQQVEAGNRQAEAEEGTTSRRGPRFCGGSAGVVVLFAAGAILLGQRKRYR